MPSELTKHPTWRTARRKDAESIAAAFEQDQRHCDVCVKVAEERRHIERGAKAELTFLMRVDAGCVERPLRSVRNGAGTALGLAWAAFARVVPRRAKLAE